MPSEIHHHSLASSTVLYLIKFVLLSTFSSQLLNDTLETCERYLPTSALCSNMRLMKEDQDFWLSVNSWRE